MGFINSVKNIFDFKSFTPLAPQMIHSRGSGPFDGHRIHLRIEPGGKGVLVIDAAKVIYLNQTAAEYAKLVLENMERPFSEGDAVKEIRKRYKVDYDTVQKDYIGVREKILALAQTDEICPVSYLGFNRVDPFSITTSAPHRMDLALTYNCNNKCGHCYVEREKGMASLTLAQWKEVLNKLWDVGVPHVCFTGGEATVHPDLTALIEYAEEVGIVTGLLTNGRRLADADFTKSLVDVGLDHVQITLESHIESIHDEMVCAPGAWKETVQGVKMAVDQTIYLVTNSTLCKKNASDFLATLDFLKELGVNNFACNGFIQSGDAVGNPDAIDEKELPQILKAIQDKADDLDMRFIWYTPTQYCNCNPVELELGLKRCTAGVSNMCIEPDGTVLPCQSYYQGLGNFLSDKWEDIWSHEIMTGIRERKWIDPKCDGCDDLELCGGGCPLYTKNGKYLCSDAMSNPPT